MVAARPTLGDDPVVARAHATAAAWLEREPPERHGHAGHPAVLGHGDPCLANYLWDGDRIRLIDFEDCGPSDRAFELAILTEHISAWSDARLEAEDLLAQVRPDPGGQNPGAGLPAPRGPVLADHAPAGQLIKRPQPARHPATPGGPAPQPTDLNGADLLPPRPLPRRVQVVHLEGVLAAVFCPVASFPRRRRTSSANRTTTPSRKAVAVARRARPSRSPGRA